MKFRAGQIWGECFMYEKFEGGQIANSQLTASKMKTGDNYNVQALSGESKEMCNTSLFEVLTGATTSQTVKLSTTRAPTHCV